MSMIKKLSNKIRVVLEPIDHIKTTSFGIYIKTGSDYETEDNNGISHLIEHMLFQGTTNRDANTIANDIADVGDSINAYTTSNHICIYSKVIEEDLLSTIDIIQDIINNPVFNKKDLIKEKDVILNEINMLGDEPMHILNSNTDKFIWKNHPISFPVEGTKENIKRLSRRDLISFYNKFFTAENIVISAVGKFKQDVLLKELEKSFGCVPRSIDKISRTTPKYNKTIYKKKLDIMQAHMVITYNASCINKKEIYALTILNNILGYGGNSRLMKKIRNELGLTYDIYSLIDAGYKFRLLQICTSFDPENKDIILKETESIISDLIKYGVTEKELQREKIQVKRCVIMHNEMCDNMMHRNGLSVLFSNKLIPSDTEIERCNSVTNDDIMRISSKIFKFSKQSISLIGNIDSEDNINE